ncbi:MAG: serine hydrolase domain-containing protein [Ktedonobacterales bacterium]
MDLDAYFAEQSRRHRFSGSVFVGQVGRTLLDSGYGDADRGTGRPNTPSTTFQIASVSKQFTAAAILLLQERGALCVQDRIRAWVSGCPEEWEPITVHHLLTHTSGIGHWQDFPELNLCEPNTRENLLRAFQRAPLTFSPGAGWAYSSPGYVLLAHIVEQVSGEPYAAFLRRGIFEPLGMTRTGAGSSAPYPEQRAVGYAGKKPEPSFELDTVGIGAGDIWATTGDVARWDAALATPGRLLSAESLRAMFFPYAATTEGFFDIPNAQYGYGWFLCEVAGHPISLHMGDNAGFGCLNARFPDLDTIAILLSNDEDNDVWKLGRGLVDEVLGNAAREG